MASVIRERKLPEDARRSLRGYPSIMQLPMVGSWSVEVKGVAPFTIHGDVYYELRIIRLDDPSNALLAIRAPQHAVAAEPQVGDKLSVTFLMGQVTAVKPL
jgi:hypothetical protein